MECGPQVGVERSVQASQADATRMHVTSGFCPGGREKHNLGQGQRGQPEEKEKQAEKESFQEKREADKEWGGDLDLGKRGAKEEGVDQAFCQEPR